MCLPISCWVIYEDTCPQHTECSAVFAQKWHDPVPLSPYSPGPFVFISLMRKVLKQKSFSHVQEVKQKDTPEALKGIKIDKFKNSLELWKKKS